MIKINNEKSIPAKSIAQAGAGRVTITAQLELEEAVEIFRHVEVIEAETLDGTQMYLAAKEGGAELVSLHRFLKSGNLMVTLEGIEKAEE